MRYACRARPPTVRGGSRRPSIVAKATFSLRAALPTLTSHRSMTCAGLRFRSATRRIIGRTLFRQGRSAISPTLRPRPKLDSQGIWRDPGLQVHRVRSAAAGRTRRSAYSHLRACAQGSLSQRQADRTAADLRRPGRDRDRECPTVRRGAGQDARPHGGAHLPDRKRQYPQA